MRFSSWFLWTVLVGCGVTSSLETAEMSMGPLEEFDPTYVSPSTRQRGPVGEDERLLAERYEAALSSLVRIEQAYRCDCCHKIETRVLGSGFVWDANGYLVTNAHVVETGNQFEVVFSNSKRACARLVGRSDSNDVAVLKVDSTVTPLPLGRIEDLKIGHSFHALGHPLDLGPTLKTGRIVGLSRTVHSLENLIQLEASVYPGDSGGPMMDSDGRLVGMLTLALHSHGRHSNIGFAVSIETLIKVVPSLIRSGQDRK